MEFVPHRILRLASKMNSRTLIIGNKNYSSWSLRAWLFLRKNNIEFAEKQLWLDVPEFKSSISQYGSGGKVPVLRDSGIEVWDSLAIIEYSIDRFGCESCWPVDANWRAHARSIVCEIHSSFPAMREECPMDIRCRHEITLSDDAQEDINRVCEIWTQALEMSGKQGRWLYGDFSPADAMFAPVVFRFSGYGVKVSPLIQAYVDFVLADDVLGDWMSDAARETRCIDL
jgi:glutathione S-transferase